jgi:GDP-D-mannose dehydratase
MRRALVTKIGGQDGSYLGELLLRKDYDVYGTLLSPPQRLPGEVRLVEIDLADGDAVAAAIEAVTRDHHRHRRLMVPAIVAGCDGSGPSS